MSEFELSTDELIRWLDKKYSRHGEIEDGLAAERLKLLSSEGGIKTRALEVACRELNNWAGYMADRGDSPYLLDAIGRTLDQCRNARHGTLSSDPWPEVERVLDRQEQK